MAKLSGNVSYIDIAASLAEGVVSELCDVNGILESSYIKHLHPYPGLLSLTTVPAGERLYKGIFARYVADLLAELQERSKPYARLLHTL